MYFRRKQSKKQYWIYVLYDPRNPEPVRYVGMANNPQSRFDRHYNFPTNWKMREWVQELKIAGVSPAYEVLSEGPWSLAKARKRELQWIARYMRKGHPLLNVVGTKRPKGKRIELIIPLTKEEYETVAKRCRGLGRSPAELVKELFLTVSEDSLSMTDHPLST